MKKILIVMMAAALTAGTFSSCGSYHSLANATSIGQLSANPFMQNVARSVLKNIGNTLVQSGIKNAGKLGLGTNLSSLLSTAQAVSGFKNMLSSTYGISNQLIDKNYSKMNSIRDVIGMVSTQGTKGLNFFNF
jgi:predicted transcriptional regulator